MTENIDERTEGEAPAEVPLQDEAADQDVEFLITEERMRRLPYRAKIAIQQVRRKKEPDLRGLRDLIATFMVDEKGEYLEVDVARELIEEMDEDQQELLGSTFAECWNEYMLPKQSGRNSSRRSGTGAKGRGGEASSS